MSRKILINVSMLFFSMATFAGSYNQGIQRPSSSGRYYSVEDCAGNIYEYLNTFLSLTQKACSFGRTDAEFQRCTVNLAQGKYGHDGVEMAGLFCAQGEMDPGVQDCAISLLKIFGKNNIKYTLGLCQKGRTNQEYAKCVMDLFYKGGQKVEDPSQYLDGHRLCMNGTNRALNSCIVKSYQNQEHTGPMAAITCFDKYDPMTVARHEAERRRAEEERRRLDEERKAAELRRQQEILRLQELRIQEQQRLEREARIRSEEIQKLEDLRRRAEIRRLEQLEQENKMKRESDLKHDQDARWKKEYERQAEELHKSELAHQRDEMKRPKVDAEKKRDEPKSKPKKSEEGSTKNSSERRPERDSTTMDIHQDSPSTNTSSPETGSDVGVLVDLPNL